MPRTVLWWGRFDPDYSRNRILRQCFTASAWHIDDFHPRLSTFADIEARARIKARPDLVWVPCFRQRDIAAAARWARRHDLPLVFDPLISAYDKQVFERGKFAAASSAARRLLREEQRQFQLADVVIADTAAHAAFFRDTLGVPAEKIRVIPVGAEEVLFTPQPWPSPASPLQLLFFGSFIELQGPELIIEAARLYQGPPLRWCLVGSGRLRAECEKRARGLEHVSFEDWLPYEQLPARIGQAHLVLGIFGGGAKAARVIPNKVYQALACARPVITLKSAAYPPALQTKTDTGLYWVQAGDAQALADHVAALVRRPKELEESGRQARRSFENNFSQAAIRARLAEVVDALTVAPARG